VVVGAACGAARAALLCLARLLRPEPLEPLGEWSRQWLHQAGALYMRDRLVHADKSVSGNWGLDGA
jgi:hypothetical protein